MMKLGSGRSADASTGTAGATLSLASGRPSYRLPMAERGRLMHPREFVAEYCSGKYRPRWIVDNAPTELRVQERPVLFWEHELLGWLADRRVTR